MGYPYTYRPRFGTRRCSLNLNCCQVALVHLRFTYPHFFLPVSYIFRHSLTSHSLTIGSDFSTPEAHLSFLVMQYSILFHVLAFTVSLVVANYHEQHARRHSGVAKRSKADVGLHKRFSNARFTFYAAGLGACGKTNSDNDFIVALNQAQYGSGSDCFKEITITANGKTHGATIVDECPGCPYGGLDMSKALFDFFAAESLGVITGSWDFASGGGGGGGSSGSSQTTHSSHKTTSTTQTTSSAEKSTPSHTSTFTSTSTSTPTTFSLSSSSASISTSTSSTPPTTPIDYLTGDASGLAEPTGAVGPGAISNLNDMNQVIIDLGAIIVAGGNAN